MVLQYLCYFFIILNDVYVCALACYIAIKDTNVCIFTITKKQTTQNKLFTTNTFLQTTIFFFLFNNIMIIIRLSDKYN